MREGDWSTAVGITFRQGRLMEDEEVCMSTITQDQSRFIDLLL